MHNAAFRFYQFRILMRLLGILIPKMTTGVNLTFTPVVVYGFLKCYYMINLKNKN